MTNLEKRKEIALRDKRHLLPDIAFPVSDEYGSYDTAFRAAGLTVLAYESFGSYQGDWRAKLQFPNGEVYYCTGSYGSCGGCDAFEAEFGYGSRDEPNYLHRLKDFAREYISDCYTKEPAITHAAEHRS